MRARPAGVVASIGVALVLCAGCQSASGSAPAGQLRPGSGDSPGQLTTELAQIQSTLDSVSAQINADSTP